MNRLDNEGDLPAYAWPGGYPVYYLKHDNVICPKCASRDDYFSQPVVTYVIHWENDLITCDNCGALIESAYGDE